MVATPAQAASPGSPGLGDPFFPRAGNGGYEVRHYDVALQYTPGSNLLRGRVLIRAVATQDLSRFNLDLRRLQVGRVTVEGERAGFRHRGGELEITPVAPLLPGQRFEVVVSYRGHPRPLRDPDGSKEGWFATDDGAFVVGEPLGTPTWMPCNNYPTDKATWTFRVGVPKGFKAVANGVLKRRVKGVDGRVVFWWRVRSPMATYLATINVGRGRLVSSRIAGVPSWVFVDPDIAAASRPVLSKLPRVMRFFRSVYGPYPFEATGAIVDQGGPGYALETQTRPIFNGKLRSTPLLVHEIAHEWFGNSVTLRRWPEIWLHEGFATWSEWFWGERHGGRSARRILGDLMKVPAGERRFWRPAPARPGIPRNLFDETVYVRGAMVLQALRQRIGTKVFLGLLRRFAERYRHGNATTANFNALAERRSGKELDDFFRVWLFSPRKPGSGRD